MASLTENFLSPTSHLQTQPSNNQTFDVIPPHFKELWERWNIRGLILFSLSLQTFLILCAPLRKRTSRKFPIFLIWSAYLLADWTASFIVGLISSNQSKSDANVYLLAFWAPFLLLHLGGPDTITAFALEDNALWLRHLIGLIFQVVATVYVFIQTIPQNKLRVPAILMFLAGIIKYAERTRALYLASLGSFRASMLKEPDPGPDYAKLMEEFTCKKDAHLPTTIQLVNEPNQEWSPFTSTAKEGDLNQLEVVQYAFLYFNKFKGLIVDLIFSFKERNESRDFFLKRTPSDALKVIEVELNFIYEVLFTKVVVIHNLSGLIFRFISSCSVTVALVLFSRLDKTDFRKLDVRITYALLVGALALDFVSISMTVFSDWTIATLIKDDSILATFFEYLLWLKRQRVSVHKKSPFSGLKKLDTPRIFRRWRESVSQFNLIAYCLSERIPMDDSRNTSICCGCSFAWNKTVRLLRRTKDFVIDYLGAKEFFDDWKYVSRQPVFEKLWDLIFEEMLEKSKAAETVEITEEICSSRGSYVLKSMDLRSEIDIGELISDIDEVAFDESLMLWHIATELCYRDEQNTNTNVNDTGTTYREFSKLLSDYMLYLIVMLPSMMSAVAGIGEIRFRDTCAEAKKFFDRRRFSCTLDESKITKGCREILAVNVIDAKPVEVKGDKSKSVLFNGSLLARKLKKYNEKWEIMSKVWIEMLSYAASHCRPDQHAQQVSKGGELITMVWLLMAHFGLGGQFQISEGHARAKLRVHK
ncbi:uncharacterized protein E6C27_scaffold1167G00360 [Cucumis melo var. makuwa]|uniref:DUF4220 domain-containing protein n=1 Tax=Cucumis melo var. makuwa TaxID=1194695 RepID=A0A5A7TN78_CUCMM|nr:uncharacterized protein E6C27_scaffold1167G00360 [Cucumis melo var. makuwa]